MSVELDLVVRLLLAALVGAAVGWERELHGHPAGMRTHLLVAVGSAIFTILSFHGFDGLGGAPVDPTRIAAQVVSGIGFLGAGAILKEGLTIRGLTTAASLWATAALGMAAAVAAYGLAAVGTAIVVVSLWPLHRLTDRLHGSTVSLAQVRVQVRGLAAVGAVLDALGRGGLEVGGQRTRRLGVERYQVDVDVRRAAGSDLFGVLAALEALPGVEVVGVDQVD